MTEAVMEHNKQPLILGDHQGYGSETGFAINAERCAANR